MDPRQLLERLLQLKQESEAIMQQLASAGVPQEAVMAALQGGQGGPPMPPQGGPLCRADLPCKVALRCRADPHRECLEAYWVGCDDNRVSTKESRPNPRWGRLLRDTLRRWRVFWLPDQAESTDRYTPRRRDVVKDNLLRCHLFGIIR